MIRIERVSNDLCFLWFSTGKVLTVATNDGQAYAIACTIKQSYAISAARLAA